MCITLAANQPRPHFTTRTISVSILPASSEVTYPLKYKATFKKSVLRRGLGNKKAKGSKLGMSKLPNCEFI